MASVHARVATGLLYSLLVVGALWLSHVLPHGLVPFGVGVGLSLLCLHELGRMGTLARPGRGPLLLVLGLATMVVLYPRWHALTPWQAAELVLGVQAAVLVAGGVLGLASGVLLHGRSARAAELLPGPLAAWTAPPLCALGIVHVVHGTAALSSLIVLSKLGDVAGYLVGRKIGRSHPFPRLSPNKTTAGCVASLVAGCAAGAVCALLGALPGGPSAWHGVLIGGGINLAAQVADLLESAVKRRAGVKDASSLAGASGGVLDVVDSLLLTIPAALFLFASLAGGPRPT